MKPELSEEDRATAIGNMHKNVVKIGRVVPEISSRTDKHTDRQTGSSQYSALPYRGRSNNVLRPFFYTCHCGHALSVVMHVKVLPYSITERRVPKLIPVLGSQPVGEASHKPGGRLPILSARSAVTPATLKRAATYFAAW